MLISVQKPNLVNLDQVDYRENVNDMFLCKLGDIYKVWLGAKLLCTILNWMEYLKCCLRFSNSFPSSFMVLKTVFLEQDM